MPIYEIEVTRQVVYKGFIRIEAEDENAALDQAQVQVDAWPLVLATASEHTDIGPIRKLED